MIIFANLLLAENIVVNNVISIRFVIIGIILLWKRSQISVI